MTIFGQFMSPEGGCFVTVLILFCCFVITLQLCCFCFVITVKICFFCFPCLIIHYLCICIVFVFYYCSCPGFIIGTWAFEPELQETLKELNCCLIQVGFTLPLFLSKLHTLKASGRLDGCECWGPYTSYFGTCKEPTIILQIWGW